MVFYGISDRGKKRKNNQDNYSATKLCDGVLLCVVCDGMGGANGGNVASALAVESFTEAVKTAVAPFIDSEAGTFNTDASFSASVILRTAADEANRVVYEKSKEDPLLEGMGTTLVAALVFDGRLYLANIGDSRLYLLSGGECMQITHDHSYVQYLVDIGQLTPDEAAVNPNRNIITRAVGSAPSVETDIASVELGVRPSYLLLCTDGLTNELTNEEIATLIYDGDTFKTGSEEIASELSSKAKAMIARANKNGGHDNITVVIVKYV